MDTSDSASESGGGGHSFVCDGYDQYEYFHFNWGWTGDADGFFAIGALNAHPFGRYYYYNESNKAIIGIEPDYSSGNTITVTASVNDASMGTVNGSSSFSHTYNKYIDEVNVLPVANEGYRFVGWSNGSKEVPLKFLANGDNVNMVANFEPIAGDTLYYCNNGNTKFHYASVGYQYAAIRIPKECLRAGDTITHVMFFSPDMCKQTTEPYEIRIYKGSLNSTPYSFSSCPSFSYKWATEELPVPQPIDVTQDLYIAIKSPSYVAASMSAANADASWAKTDFTSWSQMQSGGAYVSWMIKAITSVPEHYITIHKNAVQLTALSRNEDLRSRGLAVSNQNIPVTYEIVSCTPSGVATMLDDHTLCATGTGSVTIKAYAWDAQSNYAEQFVNLQIGRGVLEWNGKKSTDWNNMNNWTPSIAIPDAVNYDATINSGTCRIENNAHCYNLNIGYSGMVYVAPGGMIEVAGNIVSNYSWNLEIEANENGCGTVIFGSGTPIAAVNMYLKGTIGSDGKDPKWQLRGSMVKDDNIFHLVNSNGKWNNIHVYEWDESRNARTDSGCWKNLMVGSTIVLKPWNGYGFANYSTTPATIQYYGTLINSDKTWTLAKTGSSNTNTNTNTNVGNNLLTNSYSAPIEIRKLQFKNAKASVIFYNTGSLLEWQKFSGDTTNWTQTAPGQMLVCPAYTAAVSGMPTAIPSGQSFYVVANQDGATVSISYKDVVKTTSGPMYAPAEEEQFNVLGVRITGESGGDRAVLIECASCSDDYDDGYDGMKYFGNAALPQLYVVNDFGNTSINASESIVGKRLGVHTSDKGKRLTMTFETDKLNGYSQLKLKDLKTGMYADILSGREYQFTTTGDDDARFEVVGFAEEDDDEQLNELTIAGNTLYVGKFAGRVRMYDMSGKIVWQADVRENEWFELPELLHGVYVIKADNATIKIVK